LLGACGIVVQTPADCVRRGREGTVGSPESLWPNFCSGIRPARRGRMVAACIGPRHRLPMGARDAGDEAMCNIGRLLTNSRQCGASRTTMQPPVWQEVAAAQLIAASIRRRCAARRFDPHRGTQRMHRRDASGARCAAIGRAGLDTLPGGGVYCRSHPGPTCSAVVARLAAGVPDRSCGVCGRPVFCSATPSRQGVRYGTSLRD
jgi:hypothetical protein